MCTYTIEFHVGVKQRSKTKFDVGVKQDATVVCGKAVVRTLLSYFRKYLKESSEAYVGLRWNAFTTLQS